MGDARLLRFWNGSAIVTVDFPPTGGGISRYLAGIHACTTVSVYAPVGGALHESRIYRIAGLREDLRLARVRQAYAASTLLRSSWDTRVMFAHPHLAAGAVVGKRSWGLFVFGGEWAGKPFGSTGAAAVMKRARLLIACSEATARRWIPEDCQDRVVVLRPGIEEEWLRDRPEFQAPHCLKALLVSRLVRRKRVPEVANLFARLARDAPVQLRIVGDGAERGMVARIADSSNGAVAYLGTLDDDALRAEYRRASTFILMPTELRGAQGWEGYGIVYLEAAAHGLAVIASRSGGVPEAVSADGSLLFDPDDWEGVEAALRSLVANPTRITKMGLANREWAERSTWAARLSDADEELRRVWD